MKCPRTTLTLCSEYYCIDPSPHKGTLINDNNLSTGISMMILSIYLEGSINVEKLAGLNLHGYKEYHKSFSVNIYKLYIMHGAV